jgi:AraC family transcriptional regulator
MNHSSGWGVHPIANVARSHGGVLYQQRAPGTSDASRPWVRPSAGQRERSREVAGFVFAEARYAAQARVARHSHELAGLAIVLEGGYGKRIQRTDYDCRPGTLTLEPPGVSHAESYGRVDVRAVLVEIQPWRLEMLAGHTPVLRAPVCLRDSAASAIGRRARHELRAPDAASALVLEGLALELVAAVDRAAERGDVAPVWLRRVTERLREEFQSDIGLGDLAAQVGVHPAHLARVFRAREGCSVGEFVRRHRVEWAAGQLAATDASLSALAQAAGFFDQSHFTRVFTRQMGTSPARYRVLMRRA